MVDQVSRFLKRVKVIVVALSRNCQAGNNKNKTRKENYTRLPIYATGYKISNAKIPI